MKIAIAQIRPQVGQIESNVELHLQLSRLAANAGAQLVVFPELSITAYVTDEASELSRSSAKWLQVLEPLQQLADQSGMTIVVGVPITSDDQLHISSIHLIPNTTARVQHKHFLHEDEKPFYVSGKVDSVLIARNPNVALAICYELSVAEHLQKSLSENTDIYVASVANHARGVIKANKRLATVARDHNLYTLMANCIGEHDGDLLIGRSAVWGREGQVLGELDDHSQGIILLDSGQDLATKIIHPE